MKTNRIFALATCSLFYGCTTLTPQPVTDQELQQILASDRQQQQQNSAPVSGAMSLADVMARALKYNLDYRVRSYQLALAQGQLEATRFDHLPKLMTRAGYSWRDEDLTRTSIDSVTGEPSLANPSISSDRSHTSSSIGFTWSLLDFGTSYYSAKQQADKVLIESERRRKSMQNLMQKVRTAYWSALAAQMIEPDLKQALIDAKVALQQSQQMEQQRIDSPDKILRYQRSLLENVRLLESIERKLALARIELASLIGIRPVTPIQLAIPEQDDATLQPLTRSVTELEQQALLNNADMKESIYKARIAANETRKTLTKLFPGLSFDYSLQLDNDSHLLNSSWQQAGAQLSFNLFNLLSLPQQYDNAELRQLLANQQRMAQQMAVITQLHLARQEYSNAVRQYCRADTIATVEQKLAQQSQLMELSQTGTQLERISSRVSAILGQLRRYSALASAYEALSKLEASLGSEPHQLSDLAQQLDLAELSDKIAPLLASEGTTSASPCRDPLLP